MTTPTPTVHEAWHAVMGDIRAVAKGDRNTEQNYSFRGIDAVMNAVGPIFRARGVDCMPVAVEHSTRDVQTSRGKPARESTVLVTYRVTGPGGDSFAGQAPGEAMDMGDKGTSKAMSVALRTFLLQALCLPTQETDPDEHTYERANYTPPDPVLEAKRAVREAWERHRGPFDAALMKADYEDRHGALDAATPADLTAYAYELESEETANA